jgi:dihydrofolate reductase
MRSQSGPSWKAGTRVYVVSRTLTADAAPGVTIVRDNPVDAASLLRHETGSGEIWLFGGGDLFATLLCGGQVDLVEVTVVPVLLGEGVPLVQPGIERTALELTRSHMYQSGMVMLHYSVPGAVH